eukprot:3222290-Rhodomonas_salina.3
MSVHRGNSPTCPLAHKCRSEIYLVVRSGKSYLCSSSQASLIEEHPMAFSPSAASVRSCSRASSSIAASCSINVSHSSHTITLAWVIWRPPLSWLTLMSVLDTPCDIPAAWTWADHHRLVILSPVERLTTAMPAVYLNSGTTVMSIAIRVSLVPSSPIRILLMATPVFWRTAWHSALQERVRVVRHPRYLNGFAGFSGHNISPLMCSLSVPACLPVL